MALDTLQADELDTNPFNRATVQRTSSHVWAKDDTSLVLCMTTIARPNSIFLSLATKESAGRLRRNITVVTELILSMFSNLAEMLNLWI